MYTAVLEVELLYGSRIWLRGCGYRQFLWRRRLYTVSTCCLIFITAETVVEVASIMERTL